MRTDTDITTIDEDRRLAAIAEFRSKVMSLLNSNWPRRTDTDPDTAERAAALAAQLRNWGT